MQKAKIISYIVMWLITAGMFFGAFLSPFIDDFRIVWIRPVMAILFFVLIIADFFLLYLGQWPDKPTDPESLRSKEIQQVRQILEVFKALKMEGKK